MLGNAFSTNSLRKNLIIEREAANERGERSLCKISVNTRKKTSPPHKVIYCIITLQIFASKMQSFFKTLSKKMEIT